MTDQRFVMDGPIAGQPGVAVFSFVPSREVLEQLVRDVMTMKRLDVAAHAEVHVAGGRVRSVQVDEFHLVVLDADDPYANVPGLMVYFAGRSGLRFRDDPAVVVDSEEAK